MAEKDDRKIKMLVYGDSPAVATGFATVIRGIFKPLIATGKYDVDIYGINDRGGWRDPKEHPYHIYPAMRVGDEDVYGRIRFVNVLRGGDLDLKPPWDIVFFLQDPFILEYPVPIYEKGLMKMVMEHLYKAYREKADPEKWFKTVSYWPVDSDIKGNWVEDAVALSNYSIAYTNFGKEEIEKADRLLTKPTGTKCDVIYHGTDLKHFKPVDLKTRDEFRDKFFKGRITKDTFLVICVARNQMRKDVPRAMKVFREFQKRRPDSFLYIHARANDVHGSLSEFARNFDLEFGRDWSVPAKFDENVGFPLEGLNLIYNAADVQISTTQGEGWGLPITEAMATGTLNLAPNITSIPELFNTKGNDIDDIKELDTNQEIRGIPLKSHSTSSEWIIHGRDDFERIRPLTNVDDAVQKLLWVYDNPDKAKQIAERGQKWIQQYSWDKMAEKWDQYFQKVYLDLKAERKQGKQIPKKQKTEKADTKGVVAKDEK